MIVRRILASRMDRIVTNGANTAVDQLSALLHAVDSAPIEPAARELFFQIIYDQIYASLAEALRASEPLNDDEPPI